MYGLDNASGVNVMPKPAPVSSASPLWFTEGGAGLAASYPGQDWFNMVQAELLNILTAGGIKPEKGKLTQLSEAIKKIVNSADFQPSGNYATTTALALKLDKTSVVQGTGTSTTQVMSQDAVTKNFIKHYEYGLGNVVSFAGVPANSEENPFGGTGAVKLTGTPVSNGYNGLLYMTQGGEFKLAGVTIGGSGVRGEVSNFYSDKNTYKDRNGYVKTSKTAEDIQSVPIGASIIWNTSASIPDNFWPNEGRSFSAAEYPELAKIFPALKLPDDRGYGIRIADNGRGIDAGRTVGTYQEDAMQRIQGKVEGGTYALFWSGDPTASGAFKRTSSYGPYANAGTISGNQSRGLEFDSGSVVRTADETRMKNVAKILITRVK